MNWLNRLTHRGRLELELRKELDDHIQRQADDHMRAGLTEEESYRRARVAFGGTEQIREDCREARGILWLEAVLKDVQLSVRLLRKSPGFTVAAVGTLALGIGANTAIFQLLDAVRLRTLPVQDPQQLVMVQFADHTGLRGSQNTPYPALTNPVWDRFRDTQTALAGVLAWGNSDFNIAQGGEARPVHGIFVSGEFFRLLGVKPLFGRVFTKSDDRRGCGLQGAVISYAFWQHQFAGDPSVIGRKLSLDFHETTVIGVAPAGFSGLEIGRAFDVAIPICAQAAVWNDGNYLSDGTVWWLTVLGRLQPGITLKRTNAQLAASSAALFSETLPANYPAVSIKDYLRLKLQAVPASTGVSLLREQYGDRLLLLLGTASLVLLIACANLANLILARATVRAQEFAMRLALGASRRRLIQQLMTEGLLLAVSGAVMGAVVSETLSHLLISLLGTKGDPLFLDLQINWRMLGFTAAVAGLTCILFGLAPALQATRAAAHEALKTSGRTLSTSRERVGLRQVLVVTQVSLSLVLLVIALLFSGSLRNLLTVDTGFQQNGLLIAILDFARLHIPSTQRIAFQRHMLDKVRAVPGIASAAQIAILPLTGNRTDNSVWRDQAPAQKIDSNFNWMSANYLQTTAMTLLAGRDFNDRDTIASPRVAIVNQSFVRQLGFGGNPVGMTFRREPTPSEPETVFEIVGLVRDTKYASLREGFSPIAFLADSQTPDPAPYSQILIRSTLPLESTASAVRLEVTQLNPSIGIDFRSFETNVREGLLRERLMATLSSFFGVLAVLIASLGLYGVMSYLVTRRTNEIGVRVALGANRIQILGLIMRQAIVLLLAGLAIGALLAALLTGALQSMLFGLEPHDLRMLALSALLLATVTSLASYIPSRRAARMEPMRALRHE